jgi:SET domain-containing protein
MDRGVFTSEDLAADTLVEVAPVIVMTAADRSLLDQTPLHDYIFEWGEDHTDCAMALGYIPVYNHAAPSNCEYEMDFEHRLIRVRTVRNIRAGEQLFINYNGNWDHTGPVWFPAT